MSNSFNVDWQRRYDLAFRGTEGLTNPLNDNKPIKISRDGQELPSQLGQKVISMFNEEADAAGVPKPPPPSEPQTPPTSCAALVISPLLLALPDTEISHAMRQVKLWDVRHRL